MSCRIPTKSIHYLYCSFLHFSAVNATSVSFPFFLSYVYVVRLKFTAHLKKQIPRHKSERPNFLLYSSTTACHNANPIANFYARRIIFTSVPWTTHKCRRIRHGCTITEDERKGNAKVIWLKLIEHVIASLHFQALSS